MSNINLSTTIDLFDNLNLYAFVFDLGFNVVWKNKFATEDTQCFSITGNLEQKFLSKNKASILTFSNNYLNTNLMLNFSHNHRNFEVETKYLYDDNNIKHFLCIVKPLPSSSSSSQIVDMSNSPYFSVHREHLSNLYASLDALGIRLEQEELYEILPIVNNAFSNCQKMYKDTLNLSEYLKIKHGEVHLKREAIVLQHLLTELIERIKFIDKDFKIKLHVDANAQNLVTYIDVNKITMAFLNVIVNSIRFNSPEHEISISISKFEEQIKISIKDDGFGIAEEVSTKVFEPFFSFDPKDGSSKGIGMGLPITKEIIQVHGGKVLLISKQNNGTEVVIYLPTITPDAKTPISSPAISDKNHKLSLFNVFMSDVYQFASY